MHPKINGSKSRHMEQSRCFSQGGGGGVGSQDRVGQSQKILTWDKNNIVWSNTFLSLCISLLL